MASNDYNPAAHTNRFPSSSPNLSNTPKAPASTGVETHSMKVKEALQEINEFDEMEALLSSAQRYADKMRENSTLRRAARTQRELSEDYAERLAEKATFRRLLSDEALDGTRLRWWFRKFGMPGFGSLDEWRHFADKRIMEEEGKNGPSA